MMRETGPRYLSNHEFPQFVGIPALQGKMLMDDWSYAALLTSMIDFSRRLNSGGATPPCQLTCPDDINRYCYPRLASRAPENLTVMAPDTHNQVIQCQTLYQGTVNSSTVRPVEVMRTAVAAGNLPNIELIDHLVIGHHGRYTSLKEKGLGYDRYRQPNHYQRNPYGLRHSQSAPGAAGSRRRLQPPTSRHHRR